jgi:hypothetical protein
MKEVWVLLGAFAIVAVPAGVFLLIVGIKTRRPYIEMNKECKHVDR